MEKINNFKDFKRIYENKSIGTIISDWYYSIDNDDPKKERFRNILSEFLTKQTRKRKKRSFNKGDVVLIEYWYKDILTPVKIIEKIKRKYRVTHSIDESEIFNAPEQLVSKQEIVDFYYSEDKDFEKNIDLDIPIEKAVNLINPFFQLNLYKKLKSELEQVSEKSIFPLHGKFTGYLNKFIGFSVFIKTLSALGVNPKKEDTPKDMILLFITNEIASEKVANIFSRFKTLSVFKERLENLETVVFYYGITNNTLLEYGIIHKEKRIKLGEFKLLKTNIDNILSKNNVFLESLKNELKKLDTNTMKLYGKVKEYLSDFSPGFYHSKKQATVEDGILKIHYHGLGDWQKGIITTESLNNIKGSFREFAKSKKLNNKIKFSIIADKMWVVFKIKKC